MFPNKQWLTINEFKLKYGEEIINQSEKVKLYLDQLKNERDLGISEGLISLDDFSYMYMFLEFKDPKKSYRKQNE